MLRGGGRRCKGHWSRAGGKEVGEGVGVLGWGWQLPLCSKLLREPCLLLPMSHPDDPLGAIFSINTSPLLHGIYLYYILN